MKKLNIIKTRTLSFEKEKRDIKYDMNEMIKVNMYGIEYEMPNYSYTLVSDRYIIYWIIIILNEILSDNKTIELKALNIEDTECSIRIKSNYKDYLLFCNKLLEKLDKDICNIRLK